MNLTHLKNGSLRNIIKNNDKIIKFSRLKNKNINWNYFSIFKEVYYLIKLNLRNKRRYKLKDTKRILIINTCLIGDFIASLPALKYFLNKRKGQQIDIIVSPSLKPLTARINGIKNVISVKSIFNRDIESKEEKKELPFKEYDYVLIMRLSKEVYELLKNIKYNSIKTYLGPYLRYGLYLIKNLSNKETIKQWREINFEIIREKKNREPVKFKDIFTFNKQDSYFLNKLSFLKGNEDKKKIIIHTGSGWKIKLWNIKNWIKLIDRINRLGDFQFIFIGMTDKEEDCFNKINEELDFDIYSTIKQLDIKETTLLMQKCNYFIGVDSGPRHIADLTDLPGVCLLGPGPKAFKPINKKTIIIDKSNCGCTNLFCYRKKTCIEKISVNEVFNKFKTLYKSFN